ncbi:hypothetical protein PI124_g20961 [Phytophthora idaei]|nr:hypothetical protein PI124_g20961 [Phytophthora idaei]
MLTCAHIVVAERSLQLTRLSTDPNAKLKNRIQRKGKSSKTSASKRKATPNSRKKQSTPAAGLTGRPPRASSALDVQFIVN